MPAEYTTKAPERQKIDPVLDPVRFHQQLGSDHDDAAVGNQVRDGFVGLTLTTSKEGCCPVNIGDVLFGM